MLPDVPGLKVTLHKRKSRPRLAHPWQETLLLTMKKEPRPILANALVPLRWAPEFAGLIAHDEFSLRTIVTGPLPWDAGPWKEQREWTTRDDLLLTEWMQMQDIRVPVEIVQQAVEAVAAENTVHPIREYLGALKWDGTPRVDSWLTTYAGAAASDYVSAVGRRFLISAVARIMRPGCKVDTMLILEGGQGIGKSTLLQILGGAWFSDEIGDLGSKDAAMMARHAWIIEMSELDAMGRGEATAIKAFLARSTDRYRPPYGRRIIEAPRQCVITGTTNSAGYLKDETGARRFWPVKVTRIERAALRRDRDQLWAEAMHLFKADAKWWLDTAELVQAAGEEQADRYVGDPWDEAIGRIVAGLSETSVPEILAELGVETAKRTQQDANRVARVLKTLGFERYQKREGSERVYRYRRRT